MIQSIAVSFLATKCYRNLRELLTYLIAMVARDFWELPARLIIYK